MQKVGKVSALVLCILLLASVATATNGDNMIAIGPIARAMGGVGIAHPMDAISAVFANPAAMCFGPYCRQSEFNFAGSAFMPQVDAKIISSSQTVSAESDDKVYAIPAIGLSVPISEDPQRWRFGLAAYGVSGLGVDYRNTDLDNSTFYDFGPGGQYPLASGDYTQLQIMKFAPAIAFQATENLSLGLALHIDYATLDLREGSSSDYGLGVQLGVIYKPADSISLGFNYISPQSVTHSTVAYLDMYSSDLKDLELESPQQAGLGVAYNWNETLIVEADAKWINWSGAAGYEDFDWDDQWVLAIGAQLKVIDKLYLRIGYNYAENPVKEHEGFDGSFGMSGPNSTVNIQGNTMPAYYYETFRIIGFPAIAEHHLTLGVGYEFTPGFSLNIGYMHAFETTIRETGTNPYGETTTLESTLSEDSLDLGLTWRF